MPQPTISDVHVDRPLTNLSVAYMQSADAFVSGKVFPVVPVAQRSDEYYTYDIGDWTRIVAEQRAPGAPSAGGGYTIGTDNFFAKRYSVHDDIDDLTRANQDQPLNADADSTDWVTDQMLRLRERTWGTQYFSTGVWTNEKAGVASGPTGTQFLQWDQAGSTPVEDVTGQEIAVAELTGYRPNGMVTTPYVFNVLKNHPDIIDRIKYTQTGIVTEQILATLFDVENFYVAWGISNTAEEGATDNIQFMLGKHVLLYYAPASPGIKKPSAGYTFSWTGLGGSAGDGIRIKRFRIEENESDRIEADMAWDQKKVADSLGVFFKDAVA